MQTPPYRKDRRTFEKYTENTDAAAEILKTTTKTIKDLLEWLEAHLGQYELINIHHWTNTYYYIVVVDQREGWSYPANSRLGFTVDMSKDEIFWKGYDESRPAFGRGGNCFVRTSYWKTQFKRKFGEAHVRTGKIHWYSNAYLKD